METQTFLDLNWEITKSIFRVTTFLFIFQRKKKGAYAKSAITWKNTMEKH